MTRINTNVSSLNAQKSLQRSNVDLQTSLTRLSTGLRINVGKDDPAGLIASEVLRSDIISVQRAITNSERANQMIATADSALGQVSSLLNDIRGLVSEAANTGALSAEQISANQLQVDSSLEAIDRIAQVTSFQGKRLLDGNMDFVTEEVDTTKVSALEIQQANFGTQTQISVNVDVVAQAERAQLTYSSNTISSAVVLEVGGSSGFEAFSFAANSTVAEMAAAINLVSDALGISAEVSSVTTIADTIGRTTVSSTTGGGTNAGVNIVADTAGATTGDIAITYTVGDNGTLGATWTAASGSTPAKIDVTLGTSQWTAAVTNDADIALTGTIQGAATNADDLIQITSVVKGASFNGLTLVVNSVGGGDNTATYDYDTNTITVDLDATPTTADIEAAIDADLASLFSVTLSGENDDIIQAGTLVFTNVGGTTGIDGAVIDGTNTANAVFAVINGAAGTDVTASATGDGTALVTAFTHNAVFGSENAGLTTDPNNGMQFLAPDGAADLDTTFQTNGSNQSLSISFTANAKTGGYATAYVQGANANASIQVTAINQGTQYDNVTVSYVQSATDESVVWDEENSTITVYDNFTGGVTAGAVITAIDNAMGTIWDASGVGADTTGNVAVGESGVTSGGNEFTGITINLATDASGTITSTASDVITAVNASTQMQTLGISAANLGSSDGSGLVVTGSTAFTEVGVSKANAFASGTTINQGGTNARLTLQAKTTGALYNDIDIVFRNDGTLTGGGDEYMSYDAATKEFNIYINSGTSTSDDVFGNFTTNNNPTEYALFSMTQGGDGTGVLYSTDSGTMTGGVIDSGTSDGGVALIENHDSGDMVGTPGLELRSVRYGSSEFVSVTALEGSFQMTNAAGEIKQRDAGTNANVRLNGIQAITDGLDVSINTSVLDLSFTLSSSATTTDDLDFRITAGGAQFQLGPDVVSNQQARLGIRSLSTAKLGGVTGRLFKLRSGESFDLSSDTKSAAAVVDEVITQVTTLRGRLGAFQKTTLDSNIASLKDTLENLTAAESSIRDADFAAESAALTRAQILVQSGISVLSMANSNPQNVLALLR